MEQVLDNNDMESTNPSHETTEAAERAVRVQESPGTVEPWEEPPKTRGFQNGAWHYDHGTAERPDAGLVDADVDSGDKERTK